MFSVGQRVKCIRGNGGALVTGETYTIAVVVRDADTNRCEHARGVIVEGSEGPSVFSESRFRAL